MNWLATPYNCKPLIITYKLYEVNTKLWNNVRRVWINVERFAFDRNGEWQNNGKTVEVWLNANGKRIDTYSSIVTTENNFAESRCEVYNVIHSIIHVGIFMPHMQHHADILKWTELVNSKHIVHRASNSFFYRLYYLCCISFKSILYLNYWRNENESTFSMS